MTGYALLLFPAANRVYAESSLHLLRAELGVFNRLGLDSELTDLTTRQLAGVDYVTFTVQGQLSERDIALLSNLSSLYALFELVEPSGGVATEQPPLLRPIELHPLDKFDSDLLTIQKYAGKTNELFTRLLMNAACMAMARPGAMLTDQLRVLDPLCGRGTTLNQAMMYGYHAVGAEADSKDFDSYERFIKTWLKNKRLKHSAESGYLRKNKVRLGRRLDITYAASKQQYKDGDVQSVAFRNVDTLALDELFAPRSFDLIVTDAPYGVQHGSHQPPGSDTGSTSRHPSELLTAAVPVWTRLLRPGGALGISWNTYALTRVRLAEILRSAGLDVYHGGPFEQFSHRVDQAIVRDLLVASKPLA